METEPQEIKPTNPEVKLSVEEEERSLRDKAREMGGFENLSREEAIRLAALDYMGEPDKYNPDEGDDEDEGYLKVRSQRRPLEEADAMELATLVRDVKDAGGPSKVSPEVTGRIKELERKANVG